MKTPVTLAASLILAASLTGMASPDSENPPPGTYPMDPPRPTCYGSNYSYHVWNLFAPMDIYGVDSCVTAQLIANRNEAGNLANYIALVSSKVPVLVPPSVFVLAWNTSTTFLAACGAAGRGVEFALDNRNGMVANCRAQ